MIWAVTCGVWDHSSVQEWYNAAFHVGTNTSTAFKCAVGGEGGQRATMKQIAANRSSFWIHRKCEKIGNWLKWLANTSWCERRTVMKRSVPSWSMLILLVSTYLSCCSWLCAQCLGRNQALAQHSEAEKWKSWWEAEAHRWMHSG